MKHNFDIYLKDENMKHIVDENDTVQRYNKEFTIDEIIEIANNASKLERVQYGYKVYFKDKEGNRSIFIRFGNATTKSNETVEYFIRENWCSDKQR